MSSVKTAYKYNSKSMVDYSTFEKRIVLDTDVLQDPWALRFTSTMSNDKLGTCSDRTASIKQRDDGLFVVHYGDIIEDIICIFAFFQCGYVYTMERRGKGILIELKQRDLETGLVVAVEHHLINLCGTFITRILQNGRLLILDADKNLFGFFEEVFTMYYAAKAIKSFDKNISDGVVFEDDTTGMMTHEFNVVTEN